jgi:hypothetical protein
MLVLGHIQKLRKAGIGYRAIAAAADIAKSTMAMILNGERLQIRKHHADRILAVDRTAIADRALVPSRTDVGAAQQAVGSGLHQDAPAGPALFHLAVFERGSNVPKRNHQRHRLSRTWIKTERDIEFPRFLRNGVDNDSPDSDRICRVCDAAGRISKQRPS